MLITFRKQPIKNKGDILSLGKAYRISFIIAAHNEEDSIGQRILNLAALDYPQESFEIIVFSDGSTDKTAEIVTNFSRSDKRVVLIDSEEQRGRAYAHNECFKVAQGDILVFTDAQTSFENDFLRIIIPYFSNSDVACVSGRVYYRNSDGSSFVESACFYWGYEEFMRKLESDLGILAFGSGAALAVRKKNYRPIGLDEDVDRVTPLDIRISGYSVKYEPRAVAYDFIEDNEKNSYRARVRKTSRAFRDILRRFPKINPLKKPAIFISVFFHKTSRHLTPFYMIIIFATNLIIIAHSRVCFAIFILQLIFYSFAMLGYLLEKARIKIRVFYLPYNFVLVNLGRFVGVIKSFSGDKLIVY